MIARGNAVVLALLLGWAPLAAQEPEYVRNPSSILRLWNCWGARKNVTHRFPTDFQINGRYQLRQDVIVERGGTASRITPYWVYVIEPAAVAEVKDEMRDPQGHKAREIEAMREVTANLVMSERLRASLLERTIRGIQNRRESRTVLPAGTTLCFREIWLEGNFETGVSAHPYAEMLDGPLAGQWLDIWFLCDTEKGAGGSHHCNGKPEYLTPLP